MFSLQRKERIVDIRKKFMTLKIKKLADDAQIPTKGTDASAGYDLYSYEEGFILPQTQVIVATRISMKIPHDHCGLIWPRSGLSAKNGIETGAGVIDQDYSGEIKVILYNHSKVPFEYKKGMRIAQILITPVASPNIEVIEDIEDDKHHTESKRGNSGFGSTGLF